MSVVALGDVGDIRHAAVAYLDRISGGNRLKWGVLREVLVKKVEVLYSARLVRRALSWDHVSFSL